MKMTIENNKSETSFEIETFKKRRRKRPKNLKLEDSINVSDGVEEFSSKMINISPVRERESKKSNFEDKLFSISNREFKSPTSEINKSLYSTKSLSNTLDLIVYPVLPAPIKLPTPESISKTEKSQDGGLNNYKNLKIKIIIFLIVILVIIVAIVIAIIVSLNAANSNSNKQNATSVSTKKMEHILEFTTTTSINISVQNCSFVPTNKVKNSTCNYGYTGKYCDECGLKFIEPNIKIVGGVEATKNNWPSMAFIKFNYTFNFVYKNKTYIKYEVYTCGGTLINRNTILTAAHCYIKKLNFYNLDILVLPNEYHPTFESTYKVYLGLHNNSIAYSDLDKGLEINSFTIHPDFNPDTLLNDIGIIKLKNDANLSCTIQPACLPNPSVNGYPTETNIAAWAIGWGVLDFYDFSIPDNLYNVKLTVYDSLYCSDVSGKKDWNLQICAGEYSGGKDTCQGDSGGPLFVKDTVNSVEKFILVGITSYGDGCGEYRKPGIYTKVSSYLTWIQSFK